MIYEQLIDLHHLTMITSPIPTTKKKPEKSSNLFLNFKQLSLSRQYCLINQCGKRQST